MHTNALMGKEIAMAKNDFEVPSCWTTQAVRLLAEKIADRVALLQGRLVGVQGDGDATEDKPSHGRTGILFVDVADDLSAIRNYLLDIEKSVSEIEKGAEHLEPQRKSDAPARR